MALANRQGNVDLQASLKNLPEEVVDKYKSEGCENVRDIKLNKRQARACVPFHCRELQIGKREMASPWFIREEFDQVIPDDRTDEDDRKLIAKQMDEVDPK